MDEQLLKEHLGARPFRYFATTPSTMSAAQAWLAEHPNLPSGAVVIADEQHAGRGRVGRTWVTPAGTAIAMSVLWRGEQAPQYLTMAGSLAVAEALDPYVPQGISLKWSNDVLLKGKKIAGILAEAVWEGNRLVSSILGMGVNLNVNFAGTELAEIGTSLADHTVQPFHRVELIASILTYLDYWLSLESSTPLYEAWKKRLSTLGQLVTIRLDDGSTIQGQAVEVDPDGALLLELPDGTQRRFLVGDVTLRH